ncbi:Transcriptional regulatory protein [Wickerhamomyces ciferrii]|uniref:Transcriptional regulatory protein n=1 Tax=Wickerhamomyces ciferrii (strain ATCC 14091 / BCRC 22168 / CBS 111 / JCM 3599 / NBRC 0793 / NRRL Y-1031 F-60-10) TaxID=1206466 RepID=K0KAF0_WICCF|nr:Transcriptional regulatory protein [Wickerhamomyces ciferrii]CCH41940.1 Transcriptional regulatory protein [Wickerhamomyces ciferrii]
MSSSSQPSVKSDLGLDESTLPNQSSSQSSNIRSKSSSRKNSNRSSPVPQAVPQEKETNGKRRRSTRLTEQEEKEKSKTSTPIKQNHDEDEPVLSLKKRKFPILVKPMDPPNNRKNGVSNGIVKKQTKLKIINGKLHFEEPPLADPMISVTGLPLESPPNAKIKKERLWPRKKFKKSKNSVEPEDQIEDDSKNVSPEISLPPEDIDNMYRQNLKTNEYQKKLNQSQIRSNIINHKDSISTKSKNSNSKIIIPIPKPKSDDFKKTTPKSNKSQHQQQQTQDALTSTPKKSKPITNDSKRKVKNASPKKLRDNVYGFDDPLKLVGQQRENAHDFSDNTKDNDDFCSSCGEPGIFLCCENCPKSFHFACCDPPLDSDSLPDDAWFCNECKCLTAPPIPNPPGLFHQLLNKVDKRNPVQFQLPKRLRERYANVKTGKYGEYEDDDDKPIKHGPKSIGCDLIDSDNNHFDKEGNILYCIKCGTSGISSDKTMGIPNKAMTICDYCSTPWHLDCINPPLSATKQLGKKWKCPNHIDDLLPFKQRRLKNPKIIDVDQIHNFKNDGDIEIKLTEEVEDSEEEDDSEISIHEIPTPSYMMNRNTEDGVAAEIPNSTLKLWDDKTTIFRISEEGIKADFLEKVKKDKEQEKLSIQKELIRLKQEDHKLLKKLIGNETNHSLEEKKVIKSFIDLPEIGIHDLANVAKEELDKLNQPKPPKPSKPQRITRNGEKKKNSNELSKNEMDDLLMIKKLIALKGTNQLMEFLKS